MIYILMQYVHNNSNLVCTLTLPFLLRGNPDAMVVSHLPNGPTAYFTLADVVMRHDIPGMGTMSEQFPHLVFHNFKTALGERVRLRLTLGAAFLI